MSRDAREQHRGPAESLSDEELLERVLLGISSPARDELRRRLLARRPRAPLPPSPPYDVTVAVTVGQWGGIYRTGGKRCWRVCLGFVAVTYLRAEFANVLEAWLDREEERDRG